MSDVPPGFDSVEAAIEAVEAQTAAEVVVAVAGRADDYRDGAWLLAGALVLCGLGFLLYAPWFVVSELVALCLLGLVGVLAVALPAVCPPLERALASDERMRLAVDRAAKVAFVEEGVSATEERTGLLVFVAAFERQARILPDLGVEGQLPDATWGELEQELNAALARGEPLPTALARTLEACGPVLAGSLPRADDDEDELSNTVRWRAR
jgi:putative membrane protein